MKATSAVLRAIAATGCLAVMVYAFYLRSEALPPYLLWVPGRPGLHTAIVISFILAVTILALPFRAPGGREVSGAPAPKAGATPAIFGLIAVTCLVVGGSYLSHAVIWTSERPVWIDRYAPVLSPLTLAAVTVWWLYDSLYAPILTGTATGKPQAPERAKLILKRLATSLAAAGLMLQTFVPAFHVTPPVYRDAASQLMLTVTVALIAGLALISRTPAFTRSSDGSASRLI